MQKTKVKVSLTDEQIDYLDAKAAYIGSKRSALIRDGVVGTIERDESSGYAKLVRSHQKKMAKK